VADTVRTVMGIKGEPATPEDAAKGRVWSAIVAQVDQAGSEIEWVSVADMSREGFGRHPWSIGGGGAADLKDVIDRSGNSFLGAFITAMGRITHTGTDEAYFAPIGVWQRHHIPQENIVPLVEGDVIRDWLLEAPRRASG
jgi:hypothetical protein